MRQSQIFINQRKWQLYNISLDSLIEFDVELDEIQEIIEKTDENIEEKINWTSAWGKNFQF